MKRVLGLFAFVGLLAGGAILAPEKNAEACTVRYYQNGGLCGCHYALIGASACYGNGESCFTDGNCGDTNPQQPL
jgi:hypothetical protein